MNLPARQTTPPQASAMAIKPNVQPTLIIKFHAQTRQEAIERYFPDITLGGIFIRTNTNLRLNPGTKVTLRFKLGNRSSYEAQGLIAWVQHTPYLRGFGIKFLHLSVACEQFFGDMLNRRQIEMVNQASLAQNNLEVMQDDLEFTNAPTWRKNGSASIF